MFCLITLRMVLQFSALRLLGRRVWVLRMDLFFCAQSRKLYVCIQLVVGFDDLSGVFQSSGFYDNTDHFNPE